MFRVKELRETRVLDMSKWDTVEDTREELSKGNT